MGMVEKEKGGMKPQASQQWHFLYETSNRPAGADAALFEKIEIPLVGPAYLLVREGGKPHVSAEAAASLDDTLLLEAVAVGHQPYLLMATPGRAQARVNGEPAPVVTLLSVKDQVQVTPDVLLHVTQYTRPAIGPPPEDILGQECPVCRGMFQPDTIVYICPSCGKPTHCEGEEKPVDVRLECIRLGTECPTCNAPVVQAQGYTYIPEA